MSKGNDVTGEAPKELGNLANLTTLCSENNRLTDIWGWFEIGILHGSLRPLNVTALSLMLLDILTSSRTWSLAPRRLIGLIIDSYHWWFWNWYFQGWSDPWACFAYTFTPGVRQMICCCNKMDATGRWCSIVVGYAELEAHWATPLSLEVAMLPTGVKETQLRESNSQKVHP